MSLRAQPDWRQPTCGQECASFFFNSTPYIEPSDNQTALSRQDVATDGTKQPRAFRFVDWPHGAHRPIRMVCALCSSSVAKGSGVRTVRTKAISGRRTRRGRSVVPWKIPPSQMVGSPRSQVNSGNPTRPIVVFMTACIAGLPPIRHLPATGSPRRISLRPPPRDSRHNDFGPCGRA